MYEELCGNKNLVVWKNYDKIIVYSVSQQKVKACKVPSQSETSEGPHRYSSFVLTKNTHLLASVFLTGDLLAMDRFLRPRLFLESPVMAMCDEASCTIDEQGGVAACLRGDGWVVLLSTRTFKVMAEIQAIDGGPEEDPLETVCRVVYSRKGVVLVAAVVNQVWSLALIDLKRRTPYEWTFVQAVNQFIVSNQVLDCEGKPIAAISGDDFKDFCFLENSNTIVLSFIDTKSFTHLLFFCRLPSTNTSTSPKSPTTLPPSLTPSIHSSLPLAFKHPPFPDPWLGRLYPSRDRLKGEVALGSHPSDYLLKTQDRGENCLKVAASIDKDLLNQFKLKMEVELHAAINKNKKLSL